MLIEQITQRLDFCRSAGKGRYMARCPAHDDRSPSLSIKESHDGRILIHCHAGCGAEDVMTAIGLDMGDLFPATDVNNYQPFNKRSTSATVSELTLAIGRAAVREGKRLTERDKTDMRKAFLATARTA